MYVFFRELFLGASLLLLVAPLGAQPPAHVEPPELGVTALAGAFNLSALEDERLFSGLFVASAEADGIYFQPSWGKDPVNAEELDLYYPYGAPATMAFSGEDLVFCAPGGRALWRIPLLIGHNEPGLKTRRETIPLPFDEGSCRLAASRTGVIAVAGPAPGLEPGVETIWLTARKRQGWHRLPQAFEGLVDFEFSALNRVHVLSHAGIETFVVSEGPDGFFETREEGRPFTPTDEPFDLRAMSVYNGIVYVADRESIYAYLQKLDRLIPVSASYHGHGDIRDVTASYTDLYVLDEGRIHHIPRTSPVEVTLRGSVMDAQSALLDLLAYLANRDLLAKRTFHTQRDYPSLASLLREQRVLLATPEELTKRPRGFARMIQTLGFGAKSESLESALAPSFCALNPRLCPNGQLSLEFEVPADFELALPDVLVRSHLETVDVLLLQPTLEEQLARLVFDPELLERAKGARTLRQLNPRLGKVSDEDLLQVRGLVTLPKEYWTVTLPARAEDFRDPESPLREVERHYGGVNFYSYETIPGGGATQSSPEADLKVDCEALKSAHRKVLEEINFKPDENRPIDTSADVRVGIVDLAGSLLKEHEIFNSDPEWRAWHSPRFFELEPDPLPASLELSVPPRVDGFNKGSHHATHVAALIGGRRTECWSGLLPHAKMVFIPSGAPAQMADGILDAKSAFVSTFNISLDMGAPNPESSLRTVVAEAEENVLFVVAAGNAKQGEHGKDLYNDTPPEQASWAAEFGNVISVTASSADGSLLREANYGKRYVDLVTLGENLLSATQPGAFGGASGTSQATPLVTAAAAILADDQVGYGFAPGDVKARLIATARWDDELRGKVWGGRLDFSAALRFPDRDVLITGTPPASSLQIFRARNGEQVELLASPRNYERDREFFDKDFKRFRFANVLSIQKQPNGKYRIVLKTPRDKWLVILLDAEFPEGATIRCEELQQWDSEKGKFLPASERCAKGISVDSLYQYVRGGAYRIHWRKDRKEHP